MLRKITTQLLRGYIRKFESEESYYLPDKALGELLRIFPENKNLEHILLKVSVINKFYNTNIIDVFRVAKHIKKLNVDRFLLRGDPNIVSRIARVRLSNGKRNFYSFATKYCSWHKLNDYPIFDRFVEKTLMAYKQQDNFSDFTKSDLRDYPKFKRVIEDFKNNYGLRLFSFKEIDKFLWFYGKEISGEKPNKRSKK